MLIVNIVELALYGGGDVEKIALIGAGGLLALQVLTELVMVFVVKYQKEFSYALEKDFDFLNYLDLKKIKSNKLVTNLLLYINISLMGCLIITFNLY